MTGIAIYMEGGGDRSGTKALLRRGMDAFLDSLKQAARDKGLRWKLVACGSRNAALGGFKNAIATEPEAFNVLLVDAEAPVASQPGTHLQERDSWDLSGVRESQLHLMVQTMETWIIADPERLSAYYGQGFRTNRLPRRADLEQEPKEQVVTSLEQATKDTAKGVYHKIRHASDLLAALDVDSVRQRCKHCRRLFEELGARIEAA